MQLAIFFASCMCCQVSWNNDNSLLPCSGDEYRRRSQSCRIGHRIQWHTDTIEVIVYSRVIRLSFASVFLTTKFSGCDRVQFLEIVNV